MARKQSFLERLTGTQIVTDDDRGDEKTHSKYTRNYPSQSAYPDTEERSYASEEDAGTDSNDEDVDQEDEDEMIASLAIDMFESDSELIIQSMVAGVTPENLRISISRDLVTIEGRRVEPDTPEERYVTRELYWGPFTREIKLPFEIDTDGAEAVEKYGLLIIRLPKLDTQKTAELKVRSI
jgi:HSP20 family protein